MIDITMTAVIRPEVLDNTLNSFCKNIFKDTSNYRLIINIDPIGENLKRKFVLRVAKKYFDNIIYNLPETPGFCNAVIWCWSQVTSDYVFHLEDDWCLLKPINIENMIETFKKDDNLISLRLDKENHKPSKHGNKHGFVYSNKLSLNPTLFKSDFIKNVWKLMNNTKNPEKQLRIGSSPVGKFMEPYRFGIYVKDSYGKIVDDIGRHWMSKSRFSKPIGFTKWEENL